MKRNNVKTTIFLAALATLAQVPAHASSGPQERGSRPTGPPPEAIEACREKSPGDAVTITTPRGDTLKATCTQVNGELVALPEGAPAGPANGAPPERDGNRQ